MPDSPPLLPLVTEVTLRYSDLDPLGHLNNAVYSTLFEAGRVHAADTVLGPLLPAGSGFVLARIEIDFRAEGSFPGTARVETTIDRVGRSSLDFGQRILLADGVLATARSICVLIDLGTRRPTPFPDTVRALARPAAD
jgi:acyl-CoA thioester hydrolase